ncbi:DUF4434 domain-containing protein [Paenibacillus sp. GSMTC-2017]|uniref:DUF4434 domain-containing protein n=1 Tax=Paenibacillus sp. GSMTC-2017 TaxID=2794350 RepID=UPI0018D76550|nr:DUF4434 domain-containing protein [Paenibacillus sp. GSMTC-2017]MBH5320847.1 DUF4434 domain-containing protein [Paenibacillus sp. GSMTC-2017]
MRNTILWGRIQIQTCKVLCILIAMTCLIPLVPTQVNANAVNLLTGRSYTSSVTADASYTDNGGKELTDGITASPFLADAAWQGRFNQTNYTITVDLGSAKTFQQFDAGFYKYTGAGIQTPTGVTFNYSTDNVTFTPACSLAEQGQNNDIVRVSYQCTAASPVTAQYVQMKVIGTPSTWSFLDEWTVLQAIPTSNGAIQLSGTFVQPQLADKWSPAEWDKEFQYMKSVGMDHLILQWSADTKRGTAVYPTSVPGLTQNTSNDLVTKLLQKGAQYGIDIYIGLQVNDDWFNQYANNVAWLNNESGLAGQLVGDLWTQYGSYTSFKGWYLSFEVDNWHLPSATEWQRLVDFYNSVTTAASAITPGLPVMIAPFYNVSGGLNPAAWETMWNYILSRTNIDIIALQDGVGAGNANTSDLASWFAATKNAILTSSPNTSLWADTETFRTGNNPMDMKLMIDNMVAVKPYVSKYTSFSFNHYMSPQEVNPLYFETYTNYLATGLMDALVPTVPVGLTATTVDSKTVNVNWSASFDNSGVVGYHVYRDGVIIHTSYNGATGYTDKSLLPSTSYTYAVRAFDAAGNQSPMSVATSVTTPSVAYPNILSVNKSYTSLTLADVSYPDTAVTELTNGIFGTTDYGHVAWQGRNTATPYSFVIDLGQVRPVAEMTANFLQVESVFIFLPHEVRFAVSSDNSSFTDVGTVLKPAHSNNDLTHTFRLTDLTGIAGRYVKVEVIPANGAWTFIDEIEARN